MAQSRGRKVSTDSYGATYREPGGKQVTASNASGPTGYVARSARAGTTSSRTDEFRLPADGRAESVASGVADRLQFPAPGRGLVRAETGAVVIQRGLAGHQQASGTFSCCALPRWIAGCRAKIGFGDRCRSGRDVEAGQRAARGQDRLSRRPLRLVRGGRGAGCSARSSRHCTAGPTRTGTRATLLPIPSTADPAASAARFRSTGPRRTPSRPGAGSANSQPCRSRPAMCGQASSRTVPRIGSRPARPSGSRT